MSKKDDIAALLKFASPFSNEVKRAEAKRAEAREAVFVKAAVVLSALERRGCAVSRVPLDEARVLVDGQEFLTSQNEAFQAVRQHGGLVRCERTLAGLVAIKKDSKGAPFRDIYWVDARGIAVPHAEAQRARARARTRALLHGESFMRSCVGVELFCLPISRWELCQPRPRPEKKTGPADPFVRAWVGAKKSAAQRAWEHIAARSVKKKIDPRVLARHEHRKELVKQAKRNWRLGWDPATPQAPVPFKKDEPAPARLALSFEDMKKRAQRAPAREIKGPTVLSERAKTHARNIERLRSELRDLTSFLRELREAPRSLHRLPNGKLEFAENIFPQVENLARQVRKELGWERDYLKEEAR